MQILFWAEKMTNEYYISIYLDKRREKKNGKFPVKLRVFTTEPRKQVLYPTKFEFTDSEFHSIWETTKPRKEHQTTRLILSTLEAKAVKAAEGLPSFSFEAFEKVMELAREKKTEDVVFYYEQAIAQFKKNQQVSTASNYLCSLRSLLEFHADENLSFSDITVQWLRSYEAHLLASGKSKTTVGMYLRPLRAIYNTAISDTNAKPDKYPFGKKKYKIPAPKGVKKALSKEQLKVLFETDPSTPEQQKAKDFWFFSYSCNGMNFKDIANLQYKDISGDTLTFSRAKTANTNANQSPVIAYLNDYTRGVIKQYGNSNSGPETYIFPIIDCSLPIEKQHSQLINFIRFVNQHFLKFAKSVGIVEPVSTYWARHSFATNAIRSGASLEFVSEALSHSNLKTTQSYFAGFESEKKREISNKLMEF